MTALGALGASIREDCQRHKRLLMELERSL